MIVNGKSKKTVNNLLERIRYIKFHRTEKYFLFSYKRYLVRIIQENTSRERMLCEKICMSNTNMTIIAYSLLSVLFFQFRIPMGFHFSKLHRGSLFHNLHKP
jgi:hypothetical protein